VKSAIPIFILLFNVLLVGPIATGQILEYDMDIQLDDDRLIMERGLVIQINSASMEWLSDISIPYDEGSELDILEASILDVTGKVLRTLGKKEITTRHDIGEGTFFEDSWVKAFKLTWNSYPYRVKYRYQVATAKFIHLCRWSPSVYSNVVTRHATLRVTIPRNYPVTIHRPGNLKYDSTSVSQNIRLQWEAMEVGPFKVEAYSPPILEQVPWVVIAPSQFNYGIPGSLRTWSSYGAWQDRLNTGTEDLPADEKTRIRKLVEGVSDKREIIKRLYHYMQDNTRYVFVAVDVGGLKPYPASFVSSKKYGDCKALTIFMKAMLTESGIPSLYTKVNGDASPVQINTAVPGPQFNHVILCIPMGKDTVWLENTAGHLPYNYLGTFTQDRPALVVNGSASKLVKTPALTVDQVLNKETFDFSLSLEGNATVKVSKELRGDEFEDVRYLQFNRNEKGLNDFVDRSFPWLKGKTTPYVFSHTDRDASVIHLSMNQTIEDPMRKLGNALYLQSPPVNVPELETPATRTTPIRINFPINREQVIIYDVPFMPNYKVTLPADLTINPAYGQYQATHEVQGNRIITKRKFTLLAGNYPLSEYPSLYAFIKSIKDSRRQSVITLDPKP
jgi:hypothetical protein